MRASSRSIRGQTRTTKMCDVHLAPVPGSDAILAAAIGRHLLETERADLGLAGLWVEDLDAYRSDGRALDLRGRGRGDRA